MTLERAIEILNENNHDGHSDWARNVLFGAEDALYFFATTPAYDCKAIQDVDAIAIAEKYERDGH